ncbi:MAG: outer membrane beta-barrel protein [Thermodesulfobacteriota bacterium]
MERSSDMKRKNIAAALLVLFCAVLGFAREGACRMEQGAITLNAFGGGYFFEGNQNVADSPMGGLGVTYALDPNWAVEFFASYGNFAVTYEGARCNCSEKDTDVDGVATWVSVLYELDVEGKVTPFFTLGLGGLFLEDNRAIEREASLLGNMGAGLKYHLREWLWFRTELLYALTTPGAYNNAMAWAGFSVKIAP